MGRLTRRLPKATTICLVSTAAVLLAGCGGSGGGHKPASVKPAADTAPAGIRGRLLSNNELAGFTSAGVAVYTTAHAWVSSPNDQQSAAQTSAEKAMLTREGFRAGAVENLTGGAQDGGLSIVEQFRSYAAARGALAYYVSDQKKRQVEASDGKYAAFKVTGIPGAVGYSLGGATGGINIAFARADYYYLVGREGGSPRDIAGLKAAANHLYKRMGG
jgi:hypothetical protein